VGSNFKKRMPSKGKLKADNEKGKRMRSKPAMERRSGSSRKRSEKTNLFLNNGSGEFDLRGRPNADGL